MRTHRNTLGAAALMLLTAAALPAQQLSEKLSVHGYLTQGYAASDSQLAIGIPRTGTSDYRRAALLFRYAGTPKDNFVIQLAHRRLGQSPSMAYEPDVKVDWAFYERRFGDDTRLRVGKTPMPQGLFSEIRYVGTMQPFYRAPYSFYFEGLYTSETLDGVVLSQRLFGDRAFSLEVEAYGGSYAFLQGATTTVGVVNGVPVNQYVVGRSRSENALGTQVRINTPIDGVRVGGGYGRSSSNATSGLRGTVLTRHVSAEGSFERFYLRGEHRAIRFVQIQFPYSSYYAQGGVRLFANLWLNGQTEAADYTSRGRTVSFIRDDAAGLSYRFSPSLVWKTEAHRTRGYNFEEVVDVTKPARNGSYMISSLSVAF